jgi:hypothetical protein
MSDDIFLAELRADWTRATVDAADAERRMAWRRTGQRLRLLFGAICIGLYAAFALLFAIRASADGRETYWLAATAFALSVPTLLVEFVHSLREARVEYDETPIGLLLQARSHIAARRRSLWGCRIAAVILAGSVIGAIVLHALGRQTLRETATIGLTWGLTALGTWWWQARRGRRLAVQSARCERMLAEYRGADS